MDACGEVGMGICVTLAACACAVAATIVWAISSAEKLFGLGIVQAERASSKIRIVFGNL
jgi:hypothetical protein